MLAALLAAAAVTAVTVKRADLPVGPPLSGPVITLVTGDQVRFDDRRGVVPVPAPGREDVKFTIWTDELGHVHVLPEDASAALAAGKLDPRLFDINELMDAGETATLMVNYAGPGPTMMPVKGTPEFWARARHAEAIWLLPTGRQLVQIDRYASQVITMGN